MGKGEGLAVVQTALKYYPCNYYIQAVNDAVLQLVEHDDLRPEAVAHFGLRPDLNAAATMMLGLTLLGLVTAAIVLRVSARRMGQATVSG